MRKIKDSKVISVRIGQLELDMLGMKAQRNKRVTVASLVRQAVSEFVLRDDK